MATQRCIFILNWVATGNIMDEYDSWVVVEASDERSGYKIRLFYIEDMLVLSYVRSGIRSYTF